MKATTEVTAQPLLRVPVSSRVRETAAEVLRFEVTRFSAMAGVLLATDSPRRRLRSVAWEGEQRAGDLWSSTDDASPVARTALDGVARFVTKADPALHTAEMRMPGARSAVALPLVDGRAPVGAVALWFEGAEPPALIGTCATWCVAVRVSVQSLRLAEQMDLLEQRALQLRGVVAFDGVIEQAKGVLAAYLHTSPRDAYDRLQRYCHRTEQPLRQVAENIIGQAMVGPLSTLPLLDL